jgi:hypothetical protein
LFRSNIIDTGRIRRGAAEIDYSSESLFTSLMMIGIPYDSAVNILFSIIPLLEDLYEQKGTMSIDTSDIRVAVAQCIDVLKFDGRFPEETVSMWSMAYMRRYGNPSEGSVRVIDNENPVELTYSYVKKTIIPHLIRRILGLHEANPLEKYKCAFPSSTIDIMATQIVRYSNNLNLFCIRYRTLLLLLEDLILEPPHPWIVNEKTKKVVTEYNLDRASYHLGQISRYEDRYVPALLARSANECALHLCGAVTVQVSQ